MNILAVYPGRFQPFHKGHAQAYHWLKNKFGNATIATSDKVDPPGSPFNFKEKSMIMKLAGVSPGDIQQIKNPYISTEILSKYDGNKTVLVFAVSEKDMAEDPRFSFKPTKGGKSSYFQPFSEDSKKLEPFGDPQKPRGYVIVVPTFQFDVLGQPMKSATEVRKQYAGADHETHKKIIKDLFGGYNTTIHKLMDDKIKATQPKSIKQIKKTLREEITRKHFGPMMDSFVSFAADKLGLPSIPKITYKNDVQGEQPSFGGYNPETNELTISTKNRHPLDVMRTICHELIHHKQNCEGRLGKDIAKEGSTGSNTENEANCGAGIIMRYYAKKNPHMFSLSYVVEKNIAGKTENQYKKSIKTIRKEFLKEGINDPSILKVVFLAGGAGSGKDFVMKQTMGGMGFTEINSDIALEFLLKKQGLDLKMPAHEKKERDIVRGRAKNITKEKQRLALAGRNGIIINGTADDPKKIYLIKKELEEVGYDSMMVFVNTSNEVSKERNFMRGVEGKRKISDGTDNYGNPNGSEDIRSAKWKAAHDAKPFMMKLFGKENFIEFDNTDDIRKVDALRKQEIENELAAIWKNIKAFSVAPHKNEVGNVWIKNEIEKRQLRKYERAKTQAYGDPNRQQAPTQTVSPSHMIPSQGDMPNQNQLSQAQLMGLTYYGFGRYGKEINGKHTVTHINMGDKLVQKPVNRTSPITQTTREQQMTEEKMKGSDSCWKGYEMIGKKKKDGREVPNCVPVKEEKENMYPMTYVKLHKNKDGSVSHAEIHHTHVDFGGETPKTPERAAALVHGSDVHKGLKEKGHNVLAYGEHRKTDTYYTHPVKITESKTDINKDFVKYMYKIDITKPEDREFGTTSLTNIYKKMTPGQSVIENKNPVKELEKSLERPETYNAIDNVMQGIAKKCNVTPDELHKSFVDKHNKTPDDWIKGKLKKEDNNTYRINLPVVDGVGPEVLSLNKPMNVYNVHIAPVTAIRESIQKWMNNPKTQKRFVERYDDLTEQKIVETAQKLNAIKTKNIEPRSLDAIREAWKAWTQGKDPADESGLNSGRGGVYGDREMEESTSAWQRKEGKNPEGGLNKKGIASYRRENPGSKLSMAVTTEPSKLKPGSKKAKRRLSFCRRMGGMKKKLTSAKTARDPNSRINKALRKWNCEE